MLEGTYQNVAEVLAGFVVMPGKDADQDVMICPPGEIDPRLPGVPRVGEQVDRVVEGPAALGRDSAVLLSFGREVGGDVAVGALEAEDGVEVGSSFPRQGLV